MHNDVLGGSSLGDIVPDLESSGILSPARVLFDDLLGHTSAIGVAQGVDHGDFKRNVLALTLVNLVNHLDRVCPGIVSTRSFAGEAGWKYLQTNEVEANACDPVDNLFH